MEVRANINIEFETNDLAEIVYRAIKPETIKPPTERSKPIIHKNKNLISIQIYSKDLTSIRASLNSYLRWIKTIVESIKVVNKFEFK